MSFDHWEGTQNMTNKTNKRLYLRNSSVCVYCRGGKTCVFSCGSTGLLIQEIEGNMPWEIQEPQLCHCAEYFWPLRHLTVVFFIFARWQHSGIGRLIKIVSRFQQLWWVGFWSSLAKGLMAQSKKCYTIIMAALSRDRQTLCFIYFEKGSSESFFDINIPTVSFEWPF